MNGKLFFCLLFICSFLDQRKNKVWLCLSIWTNLANIPLSKRYYSLDPTYV